MIGASLMSHCSTPMVNIFLVLTSLFLFLHITDAQLGVCYGTQGNNLPSPTEAVNLMNQHNIRRVRIYNPDPSVLQALGGSQISVMIGVENSDIPGIAGSPSSAESWVTQNILNYKNVSFSYITVGNEISPLVSATETIAPLVARAMQNIYDGLVKFGLGNKIKVSTVLSTGVLGQSYTPSAGEFKQEVGSFMASIIRFLVDHQQPFLLNMYTFFPYFYQWYPDTISLEYANFHSPSPLVSDGEYKYQNLFDAIVDATYVALGKAGGANLEIVVTETGWPSAGSSESTLENARLYNTNLAKHVQGGTPRRPGKPIETYIFDLFDENKKGPDFDQNWGLFSANKQPKYPIEFL